MPHQQELEQKDKRIKHLVDFTGKLNFRFKNRHTHCTGSPEIPNQNMKQTGQRVPEL